MRSDAVVKQSIADMMTAYLAALVTPKVGLYTSALTPDENTLLAALTEPVGSWYAQVAAVFGQVFQDNDGGVSVFTQAVQFNYSGTDTASNIYGWFVAAGATPALIFAGKFVSPVPMGTLLSSLIVQPGFRIPKVPFSAA